MNNSKKIILRITIALALFALLSFPAGILADTVGGTPSSSRLVPCGGPVGSNYAEPCTLCHLVVGFHNIVQYGLFWVVTFALVGIFISGVMYIISSGDEGMITKAKGFMKASLIGFVVVAGAWMIVNTTILVLGAKDSTATGGTLGIGITNWYTFTCNTTTNAGVVSPVAPGGGGASPITGPSPFPTMVP